MNCSYSVAFFPIQYSIFFNRFVNDLEYL